VYNSQGQVLQDRDWAVYKGERAYDQNGKLLMASTNPGELHYEKNITGPFSDGERIVAHIDGKDITLRDSTGKPLSTPEIYTHELAQISRDVTGFDERTFVVVARGQQFGDDIPINSKDDLIRTLERMKDEDNLPAVLRVNASKPPFNAPATWDANGRFNTYHVINVQGINHVTDPETGLDKVLIRFTNQWGSRNDHLEGMDAQILYDAMQATPDKVVPGK
jgi:hypothetical protein